MARLGMTSSPLEQGLGLGAPVGLDDPDDDVDALAPPLLRRLEHGVGLADAGGGAHEDAEPAALGALGDLQQGVRRGPAVVGVVAARHGLQSTLLRRQRVQREVERQDGDDRLTEEARAAAARVCSVDQRQDRAPPARRARARRAPPGSGPPPG